MLSWYVYAYDHNKKSIERKDIFKGGYWKEVIDALMNQCRSKDEFSAKFKQKLMAVYWHRSEYEVVVSHWPSYVSPDEAKRLSGEVNKNPDATHFNVNVENSIKIDIFSQLMLNWPQFIDYIWNGGSYD